MRISDWSSDVCSSDLYPRHEELTSGSIAAQDADGCAGKVAGRLFGQPDCDLLVRRRHDCHEGTRLHGGRAAGAHFGGQVGGGADLDRKCVVLGKSVSVRVDLVVSLTFK